MIPGNDERRPGKAVVSSSRLPGQRQSTRELYVWGTVFTISGSRGRDRTLIIVRCPYCSADHSHSGKADFVQGKRRASCHRGRYIVLAGSSSVTAATFRMPDDGTHAFRAS